jgi:hypothetical protein
MHELFQQRIDLQLQQCIFLDDLQVPTRIWLADGFRRCLRMCPIENHSDKISVV